MNKNQKKLLTSLVLLYMVAFFAFNWNDVSWVFNYRVVSGLLYDFFNPYQSIEASSNENFLINNSTNHSTADNKQQVKYPYSSKTNTIEIPSIEISAPIILSQSTNISALTKDLDKGVVFYPSSVLPGQNGQTIVLGHSAPPNWPKIKHDWVFSDLNDLEYGDQIRFYFDNKEYIYYVREKKILEKGQEIISTPLISKGNILILVSCWPPGKDYQRIAVQAELATPQ